MKRPTPAEREQLRANVERVRRQREQAPPAAADDVDAAGLVHNIGDHRDIHFAIVGRVLELDVAATIRAGERADDMRTELGRLGFRFGANAIGVAR